MTLAIERTTDLFVRSVKEALPDIAVSVTRSKNRAGRSNYVFIAGGWRPIKVRISDHPVGMQRALRGEEDLFIHHRAKPASWAVWLSELVTAEARRRKAPNSAPDEGARRHGARSSVFVLFPQHPDPGHSRLP
jgi:hypothetical protein